MNALHNVSHAKFFVQEVSPLADIHAFNKYLQELAIGEIADTETSEALFTLLKKSCTRLSTLADKFTKVAQVVDFYLRNLNKSAADVRERAQDLNNQFFAKKMTKEKIKALKDALHSAWVTENKKPNKNTNVMDEFSFVSGKITSSMDLTAQNTQIINALTKVKNPEPLVKTFLETYQKGGPSPVNIFYKFVGI